MAVASLDRYLVAVFVVRVASLDVTESAAAENAKIIIQSSNAYE